MMIRILLSAILSVGWMTASAQDYSTFSQLVEALQLDANAEDLSEADEIFLDEPRLAYVNLTGISGIPVSKTDRKAWMEVYDGAGHYFRKRVNIHGQGGYTLRHEKTSFSCNFCEEDWTETYTPDICFGDWVKQDGFHFKAFYTDFSRGIGEIGYKMFARIVEDRQPYWERGGYWKESQARCFPDGFPAIVYLNGKYLGIYAWQLKKHRRNMNMEKYNPFHIHLDGNINNNSLFGGIVSWGQFEVRNPKDLLTANGEAYDGNTPKELMGENDASYDPADEDKQRSAAVKAAIVRLSRYDQELAKLEVSGVGIEALKNRFEEYYDLESLIDYVVFFYYTANGDGSLKNWQWFTYDGHKWMVTPYDLDQTLGLGIYGQIRPSFFPVEHLTSGPFYWIDKYYWQEILARWHELRRSGIFTAETLVPIADDWCERVGDTFYRMERQRWPKSPCYCEAICNPGWKVSDRWEEYNNTANYDSHATYQAGDLTKLEGRLWEATQVISGVKPFLRNATPDSLARLQAWIPDRIDFIDNLFDYQDETAITQPAFTIPHSSFRAEPASPEEEVVAIYTMSGLRTDRPDNGIYIFRYRNGASRKMLVKNGVIYRTCTPHTY